MSTRPIRHNGPPVSKVKVASVLKNIWRNGVNIEITMTIIYVFSTKITFKANCRRFFPAKYKMKSFTELTI